MFFGSFVEFCGWTWKCISGMAEITWTGGDKVDDESNVWVKPFSWFEAENNSFVSVKRSIKTVTYLLNCNMFQVKQTSVIRLLPIMTGLKISQRHRSESSVGSRQAPFSSPDSERWIQNEPVIPSAFTCHQQVNDSFYLDRNFILMELKNPMLWNYIHFI